MPAPGNKKTIIGKIKYTNAWPIFHYFEPSTLHEPASMVSEVPSYLNQGMSDGSIDIGALSSFAYGLLSEQLLLLPELSVSADGPVKSILLFSREPLDSMGNGTIALTNTSATSVNLLKILMSKALGAHPTYLTTEPDLEIMMSNADAALLIGDNAIKASWEEHGYYVTDLGAWWKEWTGHSMTFAVWAVNRDTAQRKPEAIVEIVDAFQTSKARSLANLQPIVEEACSTIGGTTEYWERYFSNLCYDFGERQYEGLRLYFRYAYELGLVQHKVHMEVWDHNMLIQVKE
ncbi:menaquinone biosynthetic enzyme MqnA/MqnD family protein [Paenibacillus sp. IHBB 10380]|uniref:menaquinone biosynthetic enzyme MqnA/MqnD family protein n=1 Tax=Paenibacillus sp. IHBB 10380 TaxID=1566358 RepID=UPI0005CFC4D7|nr:menaquinone biosynthesis protein [Paenibacillus sp. IHBB 10380]AJS58035.1 ABC transporter substrate-binding protein [Paenibacillus sp. IHBB 10380]